MTNEWLEEMIRRYNANDFVSHACFRDLSDSVRFGKVWRRSPAGTVSYESGDSLYFILDGKDCVGIVYDMRCLGQDVGGDDLHWFVLEEHRHRGYLHRALHSTIFLHMFQDGRKSQYATVKTHDERALRYALRQGFQVVETQRDETLLLLKSVEQYKDHDMPGQNRTLTIEEQDGLKQRVWLAKALLVSVRESLECAYGDDLELDTQVTETDLWRIADEINFLN